MRNKYEQIFIGVIFLLVGVIFVMRDHIFENFGSLAVTFLAFSFLLLYVTKRKSWALAMGCFFVFLAIIRFLAGNVSRISTIEFRMGDMTLSILFIVLGLLFLVLFHDKNKTGLLIPGAIFVAIGSNLILKILFSFENNYSFFLLLGIAFYYIYRKGRDFLGMWPKYVSMLFIFMFLIRILRNISYMGIGFW